VDRTEELLREHAGKMSDDWIAAQAGVTVESLRNRASALGISIGVPHAAAPKRQYWMSAPLERKGEIAQRINALMKYHALWSQSATLLRCVDVAYEQMMEEE